METQRTIDRRAGVIVAHPGGGQMRSFEAAAGLQQAGLLQRFVTGFYFRPESLWGRGTQVLLNGGSFKLQGLLRGRFHPELSPERVLSFPFPDLAFQCVSRAVNRPGPTSRVHAWRNQWFDRRVAKTLAREQPAAVLCYDGCALHSFRRAQPLGVLCVLDQCTAHIKTGLKLYREEAERHPEFADSLPIQLFEGFVGQCCEELERANAVVVSSSYCRQTLLDHGVGQGKIFEVPYAAAVSRFRPPGSRKSQPFRVLFVGQVSQRKGIKYLLEAFKQLALPNAELLLVGGIAGSGKGLEAYRGLFTHIPSVPYPELHSYFQLGSIFVLPGLHESGVLAIHEALASGLPVIATPNCGSVVRDGTEGFIVPIRDVEALKEKILLLYQNKDLREEMGRQARLRAEEFTWEAYRQRLGHLLRGLLDGKG